MLQTAVNSLETSQSVSAQLAEAAVLMGVGMLSVFLFLSFLILAMLLLAKLVKQFPGAAIDASASHQVGAKPPLRSDRTSPQIIAAISAAVDQYRRNKK